MSLIRVFYLNSFRVTKHRKNIWILNFVIFGCDLKFGIIKFIQSYDYYFD